MELIIAILFFAVASTICVRLFVSAHLLSQESIGINNSVLWVQNLSEVFNGKKGKLKDIADFYSVSSVVLVSSEENPEIGTLVMFFDKDWEVIDYPLSDGAPEGAKYELMLTVSQRPASEVYADCGSADEYTGNALKGDIYILNLPDSEIIDEAPDASDPLLIMSRSVDYYIGNMEAVTDEP
jgi:hypothetical protein